MRRFALLLVLFLVLASPVSARSVYTPRDSGTEPPGGPRTPDGLPSAGNFGRTPEGGVGYLDAYGNPIDSQPAEKKARKRLPPGAYGAKQASPYDRPLPDPAKNSSSPAWSFR